MVNFPIAFVGFSLLGAAAIFAYSNLAYTPDIENEARKMRLDNRETEVKNLIGAIHEHVSNDNDFEELRKPLEIALGVDSLETYYRAVLDQPMNSTGLPFADADYALAQLIKEELGRSQN